MLRATQTPDGERYEIRLSGSLVNLLILGIVAYLRDHRIARVLGGAVGAIGLFIGGSLFLFRPFLYIGDRYGSITLPLIAASFALLMSAVLAGPKFNLFIGEPPEVEERREAEEELGQARDPYSSLELDSKRLSEYYAINQSQARGSFRWAVFAMLCGFATIISGVWIFYLRENTPNTFLTSLSTAAGLVVNVVSGLYLYLHNKTQRRSLFYYAQLVRVQQLGLAIRLAESHDDPADRKTAKNKVIDELLAIVRLTAERDTADAVEKST